MDEDLDVIVARAFTKLEDERAAEKAKKTIPILWPKAPIGSKDELYQVKWNCSVRLDGLYDVWAHGKEEALKLFLERASNLDRLYETAEATLIDGLEVEGIQEKE